MFRSIDLLLAVTPYPRGTVPFISLSFPSFFALLSAAGNRALKYIPSSSTRALCTLFYPFLCPSSVLRRAQTNFVVDRRLSFLLRWQSAERARKAELKSALGCVKSPKGKVAQPVATPPLPSPLSSRGEPIPEESQFTIPHFREFGP